jgi:hypothetical protein
MTYRELAKEIDTMTEKQKNMKATIYSYNYDDYYLIEKVERTDKYNTTLEPNHPVLSTFE